MFEIGQKTNTLAVLDLLCLLCPVRQEESLERDRGRRRRARVCVRADARVHVRVYVCGSEVCVTQRVRQTHIVAVVVRDVNRQLYSTQHIEHFNTSK
jgi:hypothetical protein